MATVITLLEAIPWYIVPCEYSCVKRFNIYSTIDFLLKKHVLILLVAIYMWL